MKTKLAIILIIAVIGFFHDNAIAEGPYSFSVDRFQSSGGIFDFVDEFDDGELLPWFVDDGTAVESGGVVTISNPGYIDSFLFDNYLITFEESNFVLCILQPADEEGDFEATSTWVSGVPGQNQYYSMRADINTIAGEDVELVEISVGNAGPLVADIFSVSAGLYVSFSTSVGGGIDVPTQIAAIDEEDITGAILLSLMFDDTNDQFTGAFSLDGGVTFQSFDPFDSSLADGIFDNWNFNVGSLDVQVVPETTIDIHPDTLNLKSKGKWITCYIELPEGHDIADIDLETVAITQIDEVSLEPAFLHIDLFGPTEVGDYDGDDLPDLMVKFDRSAVQELCDPGAVEMTVYCETNDGTGFEASDTVLVIEKGREHSSEDHSSVEY